MFILANSLHSASFSSLSWKLGSKCSAQFGFKGWSVLMSLHLKMRFLCVSATVPHHWRKYASRVDGLVLNSFLGVIATVGLAWQSLLSENGFPGYSNNRLHASCSSRLVSLIPFYWKMSDTSISHFEWPPAWSYSQLKGTVLPCGHDPDKRDNSLAWVLLVERTCM